MNVDNARTMRARGCSYAEIARVQRVSPSGVFYALNPRAKSREGKEAAGSPHSLYLSDDLWDALTDLSDLENASISRIVTAVLVGAHAPLALEPVIPGVEVLPDDS